MNFKEKKELKSSDLRKELKEANKTFTECISKEFLGKFLSGDSVKVEDFCLKERENMQKLDF